MEDQMFEEKLRRVLQHDFSHGTEMFRDNLLARCLDELNSALHHDQETTSSEDESSQDAVYDLELEDED